MCTIITRLKRVGRFARDDLLGNKTLHIFSAWECVSDRDKEMQEDPSVFGIFSQMKPRQAYQSVGGLVPAEPPRFKESLPLLSCV